MVGALTPHFNFRIPSETLTHMRKLNTDHLNYSKKELLIGGTTYYVYNTECLEPAVTNFNVHKNPHLDITINVVYLVHHTSGDYTYTENIAKSILDQFSSLNSAPIIAVTFDGRNHGARKVDDFHNVYWDEGNRTHGQDIVSCVRGNEDDVKLCMDILPAHLNLEAFLNESSKENEVGIRFNNILCGYSVGAHSVIRFANRFPELVSIINPNVGCSDLSTLLINRLKGTTNFDKKYCYFNYDELDLTDDQRAQYPESLHRFVSQEDSQIIDTFPFQNIKMFASFYSDDPIVPSKISELWVRMYLNTNSASEVYYENGAIHDITPEMVNRFAVWLAKEIK